MRLMPKDSEKITKNSGIQKQEIRVDQNFGQLRLKLGGKTESKRTKHRLFFICEEIIRNHSYFVNYFMFKVS